MPSRRFFEDKHGHVVLFQKPNLLITSWLILQLIDFVFLHGKVQAVHILATATLFAWSYDELRRGVSPFRKLLGAAVLVLIIATQFMR